MAEKYGWSLHERTKTVDTPHLSIREAKAMLKAHERRLAMSPDTIRGARESVLVGNAIHTLSEQYDSIYVNPNKVRYIERNGLMTPNMVLMKNGKPMRMEK